MNPKIELPSATLDARGLPDTSQLAPAIVAARRAVRRSAHRMGTVDPLTSELVRIRNARFQQCVF